MGDDWIEIGAAWQAIDDASTRKNAKIQILAIAPFDSDMSEQEMTAALRTFCETILDPLGLPYAAVIHQPPVHGDERNFHPHILFSLRPMRRIEPYCWEVADDVRGELDGRDGVQTLRHLWAYSMSAAAAAAQRHMRYTGLGYGARALALESGEHLGEARAAMVARGDHVWAHERNRIKNARNAARRVIRDADKKIAALTKVRDAALVRIAAERSGDVKTRVLMPALKLRRPVSLTSAQSRVNGHEGRRFSVSRTVAGMAPRIPFSPKEADRAPLRSAGEDIGIPTQASPVNPLRTRNRTSHNAPPSLNFSDQRPFAHEQTIASVSPMPKARLVASARPDASAARRAPGLVASAHPDQPGRRRLIDAVDTRDGTLRRVATRKTSAQRLLLSPAPSVSPEVTTRLVASARPETALVLRGASIARPISDVGPDMRHLAAAYHPSDLMSRLVPAQKARNRKPPLVPTSSISPDTTMKVVLDKLLRALSMARTRRAKKRETPEAIVNRQPDLGGEPEDAVSVSKPSSVPKASPAPESSSAPSTRPPGQLPGSIPRRDVGPYFHMKRANARLSLPTIDKIPSRDWLEANPLMRGPVSALPLTISAEDREKLDRLVQADAYVATFGDGALEIDIGAFKTLGVDAAWIATPDIQRALAAVRADQQTVISALCHEAERRPLDFKRSGARFWPRNLHPDHLRRLDGWAADPGFEQDIMPLELDIDRAHTAHEREQPRLRKAAGRVPVSPATKLPQLSPDGFGGMRDTPAPQFTDGETGVRIAAFDPATGRPTDQLLMLLKLAGEHPRRIAFATDGLLMALSGGPAVMAPLLHGWRRDERVAALVTGTVRASRAAGKPAWPVEIASAVRAFIARGAGNATAGPAPDWSDGPSR